jgi:hypothetical protein
MSEDRERPKTAYSVFRGGFRSDAPFIPPHWDDLETWMRDAIYVGYLQGQLDRKANPDDLPRLHQLLTDEIAKAQERGNDLASHLAAALTYRSAAKSEAQ